MCMMCYIIVGGSMLVVLGIIIGAFRSDKKPDKVDLNKD